MTLISILYIAQGERRGSMLYCDGSLPYLLLRLSCKLLTALAAGIKRFYNCCGNRKYFFRIRVSGAVILNCGSGSRGQINYEAEPIRTFLWSTKKKLCQIEKFENICLKFLQIFDKY
jgi:hypothetical protein